MFVSSSNSSQVIAIGIPGSVFTGLVTRPQHPHPTNRKSSMSQAQCITGLVASQVISHPIIAINHSSQAQCITGLVTQRSALVRPIASHPPSHIASNVCPRLSASLVWELVHLLELKDFLVCVRSQIWFFITFIFLDFIIIITHE